MSEGVKDARLHLTALSLRLAAVRVKKQKQESAEQYLKNGIESKEEQFNAKVTQAIQLKQVATQFGDSSSITKGSLSSTGTVFVTVGSSGDGKIFDVSDELSPTFATQLSAFAAGSKLCDVKLHPSFGCIPQFAPNILTGSARGQLHFWTYSKALHQQKGLRVQAHSDRVNRVQYTSDGMHTLACSYDKTWSLWDAKTLKMVLKQGGHQRQIHSAALHPDNSLFATADLGGSGMVWDLRTGKGVYQFEQSDSILCCDFKQNGYQLAVGGKSNMISVFDLRRKKEMKKIPAHFKLISDLKYQEQGLYLASGSHDNRVRLWHGFNYTPLITDQLTLPSKITSIDVCRQKLVVTGIDRKWVMFTRDKRQQIPVKIQDIPHDRDR